MARSQLTLLISWLTEKLSQQSAILLRESADLIKLQQAITEVTELILRLTNS